MLHVHHSNRLERHIGKLADVTTTGQPDPFVPELVVVQNPGMARWVAQRLAELTGVSANLEFPLPATFIWGLFRAWFPDLPWQSGLDRGGILWRVMARLPALLPEPAFAELAGYLQGDETGIRRYQLCTRISDLFDQYLVFRPEMVTGWEAGEGGHWQAELWRALVEGMESHHRARVLRRFHEALTAGAEPVQPLPQRVSLFGVTALAPAYLEAIAGLAHHSEVHLFLLNPCREYWADIVDERGQARRRARARRAGQPDPSGLLDVGNPLLASMGHAGQAFLDQLLELSDREWYRDHDDFAAVEATPPAADLQKGAGHTTPSLFPQEAAANASYPLSPRERVGVRGCEGQSDSFSAPLTPTPPSGPQPSRPDWAFGGLRCDVKSQRSHLTPEGEGLFQQLDLFPDQEDDGHLTLLQRVQNDILNLHDRRTTDPARRAGVAGDDHSIQLHACHGPLREVQVLHDRLLRLFERLPGLTPREVVVMAPDIDRYAPYVDAVFDAVEDHQRIPWAIADRRQSAEQPLLEALFALLALPASRLEGSELLSLLEVPAVRRRFGLDPAGLERIHAWVRESGIRWGLDGAMRQRLGLPAEPANTWAFGLQRLFLGLAMPPDAGLYRGVLPYPDVEGGEAVALGALQLFVTRLGQWQARLARPCTPAHWQHRLNELIEAFFAPDEEEQELLQALRKAADELSGQSAAAGFDTALELETVRSHLQAVLGEPAGAHHFLTGRVTFCNMVPMRSIPFRVVCLLGMNDADFPRSQHPPSFDLLARAPRRGDRSRRLDDRYLFLEALLSARDLFYLSYLGHDPRDNGTRLPSVVVSELLDYLGRAFRLDRGDDPAGHLIVHHPLQPFSRRNFDGSDPALFSYREEWLLAARSVAGGVPPFADGTLPEPDEALRTLELEELIRFLCDPAGAFLRRLGVRLPEETETPLDVEPFDAVGLEKYQLKQQLLERLLDGGDEQQALEWLRAAALLPHGAAGDQMVAEHAAAARAFHDRLEAAAEPLQEPLEVDLRLGGFTLQGRLAGVSARGLLDYRFGRLKASDRLRLWVRHLVLNLLAPPGVEPLSLHLAESADFTLKPVDDPEQRLLELLQARWEGLSRPLPFFPESALAWYQSGEYGGAWYKAWMDPNSPGAEAYRTAVQIAFRGLDPSGEEFQRWAIRLLAPMLAVADTEKVE